MNPIETELNESGGGRPEGNGEGESALAAEDKSRGADPGELSSQDKVADQPFSRGPVKQEYRAVVDKYFNVLRNFRK